VWALGPGVAARGAVDAAGTARVALTPPLPGTLRFELRVRGGALRPPGTDVDWLERLRALGAPPEQVVALLRHPGTWTLRVPLTGPSVTVAAAGVRPAPVARIRLGVAGRRPWRGRDRLVAGRVRRADGTPAARVALVARLADGRGRRVRTGARGEVRLRAAPGRLVVAAVGTRVRAAVRVPGARPRR
jgi:hypothetical protein